MTPLRNPPVPTTAGPGSCLRPNRPAVDFVVLLRAAADGLYRSGVSTIRQPSSVSITCPLCGDAVPATASGCRECHLPMSDLLRHSEPTRTGRSRSWVRAVRVRIVGLLLYVAVVAWCAWQLPASLPFVVPAAVTGVFLTP